MMQNLSRKEELLAGALGRSGYRAVGFGTTASRSPRVRYYWVSAEKSGHFITIQTDHKDAIPDRATVMISGGDSTKLAEVVSHHARMTVLDIGMLGYRLSALMDMNIKSRSKQFYI